VLRRSAEDKLFSAVPDTRRDLRVIERLTSNTGRRDGVPHNEEKKKKEPFL
jgi:hypothetical protein